MKLLILIFFPLMLNAQSDTVKCESIIIICGYDHIDKTQNDMPLMIRKTKFVYRNKEVWYDDKKRPVRILFYKTNGEWKTWNDKNY